MSSSSTTDTRSLAASSGSAPFGSPPSSGLPVTGHPRLCNGVDGRSRDLDPRPVDREIDPTPTIWNTHRTARLLHDAEQGRQTSPASFPCALVVKNGSNSCQDLVGHSCARVAPAVAYDPASTRRADRRPLRRASRRRTRRARCRHAASRTRMTIGCTRPARSTPLPPRPARRSRPRRCQLTVTSVPARRSTGDRCDEATRDVESFRSLC